LIVRDEGTTTKQAFRKRSGLGSTLAIWGDRLVGQILELLLRSSGHEARFLPASSSLQPSSLEEIDLLVLTPTPELSTERREALLSSLSDTPEAATIPVLELVGLDAFSEEPPDEGRARSESWHTVPWPCRIEELERRIALLAV
jgi:hypothetical protein